MAVDCYDTSIISNVYSCQTDITQFRFYDKVLFFVPKYPFSKDTKLEARFVGSASQVVHENPSSTNNNSQRL